MCVRRCVCVRACVCACVRVCMRNVLVELRCLFCMAESGGTLFRGAEMVSQMLSTYSKFVGQQYLNAHIRPLILSVINVCAFTSFCVNTVS